MALVRLVVAQMPTASMTMVMPTVMGATRIAVRRTHEAMKKAYKM
jgi:hypothetical protein